MDLWYFNDTVDSIKLNLTVVDEEVEEVFEDLSVYNSVVVERVKEIFNREPPVPVRWETFMKNGKTIEEIELRLSGELKRLIRRGIPAKHRKQIWK